MQRTADDRRAALLRGAEAEACVASALEDQGWNVLARNWRGEGGELDVVVERDGRLRMVEVKLRDPSDPVGIEAIDRSKQGRLRRAAEAFLVGWPDEVREVCFLVALVEPMPDGDLRITWIDDAFDGR